MLLSFRGYLGEIESGKKAFEFFTYFFFFVNVECVRVRASNFQVLTRKIGGATAFGNIVRFLAGPARMKQNKDAMWSLVLLLVTGVRADPKYSYSYEV